MILYVLKFNWYELLESFFPTAIISVGFIYFSFKYFKTTNSCTGLKFVSISLICIAVLFSIITVLNVFGHISTYAEYKSIINQKSYKTVSGYVCDFKPANSYGKGNETFNINGVNFSYAHYEDYIGYHTASTRGGVITENGQELTINYVYDKHSKRNVILEIIRNTGDG